MARIFLKVGVIAGVISSILIIFPTGDLHGKYVARNQPAAIAAMEGLFKTEAGAGIVLMGQPNEETGQIDNPIVVNDVLSFLIYGTTKAEVKGPRPDSARPVAHRAAAALLRLPHHGRPGNLVCAADDRAPRFCSGASGFTRRAGRCGRCCSAFRCLTSPTPPAG